MVKVVAVDHLVVSVSDFAKSKAFYGRLFEFLGFEVMEDMGEAMGWRNEATRYVIRPADPKRDHKSYAIGDVGIHHYAFELGSRADVDALQDFLEREKVEIVDPAGEYYEDYYAVFFLDPDGIKLEGMKYGEETAKKKRAKAARKKGK